MCGRDDQEQFCSAFDNGHGWFHVGHIDPCATCTLVHDVHAAWSNYFYCFLCVVRSATRTRQCMKYDSQKGRQRLAVRLAGCDWGGGSRDRVERDDCWTEELRENERRRNRPRVLGPRSALLVLPSLFVGVALLIMYSIRLGSGRDDDCDATDVSLFFCDAGLEPPHRLAGNAHRRQTHVTLGSPTVAGFITTFSLSSRLVHVRKNTPLAQCHMLLRIVRVLSFGKPCGAVIRVPSRCSKDALPIQRTSALLLVCRCQRAET